MNNFNIELLNNDTINYIKTLKIEYIKEIILLAKHHYYNTDKPLISDEIYDIIEEYYYSITGEQKIIGSETPSSEKKIKLPIYMGSLDKIKSESIQVKNFIDKFKNNFILSDKLDGQSLQLEWKKNKWNIYTRGDGYIGRDVSHISNYIDIPNGLDDIIIQAEFILPKILYHNLFPNGKNARNSIAGLLTQKEIDSDIIKHVNIVCYGILNKKISPSKQFELLESLNFKVANYKKIDIISDQNLLNYYNERKDNSEFNIDGIVVTHDSIYPHITGENPKHMKAYKLGYNSYSSENSAITKVINVTWNCSRYGYLNPVINIEPINLNGVTISKVTGFNYQYIYENKIGEGSLIKIIRSGDVIPHIKEIVKSTIASLPTCKYKLSKNYVDAIIDEHNDTVEIKRIEHFFSSIGVENFSIGIITNFYYKNYNTIIKIINMSISDMLNVEGIQHKLATKIYNNIHLKLNNIDLIDLMIASCCFENDFGRKRIESVISSYHNIFEEKNVYIKILNIKGFSENLAKRFTIGLEKFKLFLKEISQYITIKSQHTLHNNLLNNEIFTFTGIRNKKVEEWIVKNGGKISDSFTKKTNTLIIPYNNFTSSKTDNAIINKTSIVCINDFINKYNINK
jgi:DNA ligase (NAD+)